MAKLRAVAEDEKPPPRPITSVSDAAERGTLLDELVQVHRVMARVLDDEDTNPTALAALARQYRDLAKEIDAMKRQLAEEVRDDNAAADESWSEEAI